MSKTYRPYNPDQQLLMPPSLREWLPNDHLAYFVSDTVDELDLSAIEAVYERSLRGSPPYHPRMMVKLLTYAYCVGVYSSRRIAGKMVDDVAFRVLASGCTPDFRTISDFRKDHLQALKCMFVQILLLCEQAGMVKLGHVALDGTKLKANASKHKAMSYSRMKDESARLSGEIAKLLELAERTDEEEDEKYGKDVRGDELPKELAFREGRRAKIRQAMAELEAEAKAEAGLAGDAPEADTPEQERSPGKGGRPKKKPDGVPDDKAQRNFTDPESRIMKSADKSFIQGYNAQAAVDSDYQVIVAAAVTRQASDSPHTEPVVEMIEDNLGRSPDEMSLDAGYFSEPNVEYLEGKGIDAYMPPCRLKHSEYKTAVAEPVTQDSSIRDRMKSKVLTDEGRKKYGLRKETVEPVFGQIKSCRGFRAFSMRGLEKCDAEWSFICSAHNLLKLAKHRLAAMAERAKQCEEPAIIHNRRVCVA
jgi:transposase